MPPTMLLLPSALLILLVWIALRMESRRTVVVAFGPAERTYRSLRERLVRGEITPEEYHRLIALIS